jgi:hypothetical protein
MAQADDDYKVWLGVQTPEHLATAGPVIASIDRRLAFRNPTIDPGVQHVVSERNSS